MRFLLAITYLLLAAIPALAQEPADPLDELRAGHPRLMLTEERMEELRALHESDENLQTIIANVVKVAGDVAEKDPLKYDKKGPRLLHVSRECLDRIYWLGVAWRWTGEERFALAMRDNLLTVCAFPDWNPSHFLDTAEMSHAVGVGYDWLYTWLDEESRDTIRQGLIRHGMEPGMKAYTAPHWFTNSQNNWNQVCNGGLIIGALALAESDPQYARRFLAEAKESYPKAMKNYAPDGAWIEGPGYWHYATRYVCFAATAMETALGEDFGLTDMEGFDVSGDFPIYTTGPTELYLNFADSGERSKRRRLPCLFYLANRFDRPMYAAEEWEMVHRYSGGPLHVVWYVPEPDEKLEYELDRYFRGPVEIVVIRQSWKDPNAAWVGVKAGYNQVPHGHLDLGNFEYDALGVRWARDLGSDNYNLPDYWRMEKEGQGRWQYYRLNSRSHNVPTLNGRDQNIGAEASVREFNSDEDSASCLIDLTEAYQEFARRAVRSVWLDRSSGILAVEDSFDLEQPCTVTWGMTTDATITIGEDGRSAKLEQDGKQLHAKILQPDNATFSAESAEQPEPEKSNKGVSRLTASVPETDGVVRLAIRLQPQEPDSVQE